MTAVLTATTHEEREAIYRFRYEIYVEEMGKQPQGADHAKKWLTDSLDETGELLYMKADGKVVATLRRNFLDQCRLSDEILDAFAMKQFLAAFPARALSLSTRLMVAPAWRSSTAAGAIVGHAYRQGLARGVQFDFNHCAARLVPLYERLGFRRYTHNHVDRHAGFQVPMALAMQDVKHLRSVRSPFFHAANAFLGNAGSEEGRATSWFKMAFPEHRSFLNSCTTPADDVWNRMRDALAEEPSQASPLLANLTQDEVKKLCQRAFVHPAREGETVIREGEKCGAMFMILSGAVEAASRSGHEGASTVALGPGQVFGETKLGNAPVSERITALTDSTLLVLSESEIRRIAQNRAELMARVMLNLLHLMAQRKQIQQRGAGG